MEVQTSEHGPVSVIRLNGSMVNSDDCEPLQKALRTLIDEGKRDFVIDLGNVDDLGPSAMGALVGALNSSAECGGRLKLARVPTIQGSALGSSGLEHLFDICSDEHEALLQLSGRHTIGTAKTDHLSNWSSRTIIEFPSTEGNISEAERKFSSFLEQLRIDTGLKFDVQVAFHEAFANAVKHGNKGDPSKCVVAECTANGQTLKIRVTDEGEGFDAKAMIELKSNPFRDRGHGLTLIRTLMDEVRYNDKGNSISMVKFCSQSIPEQQGRKDYHQIL